MFQQKDYMPKHEYSQCGGCTGGAIKEPTNTAGIKSNDPWDNLKVGCIICPPAEQYGYVVLEVTLFGM